MTEEANRTTPAGIPWANVLSMVQELQGAFEVAGQVVNRAIRWLNETGIDKWLGIIAISEHPTIEQVRSICEDNRADGECPFRDQCFTNEPIPLQTLLGQHRAGCAWVTLRNAVVLFHTPQQDEVWSMTLFSEELRAYLYLQIDQREAAVLARLETRWQDDRPPLTDQYVRYIKGVIGERAAIFAKIDKKYQEYILQTAADYLFGLAEYSRFFAIWQEHGPERLWTELVNWYAANDQVSRFLAVLLSSPLDSKRKQIVQDAVTAHQHGLYTLSVPVLLTQLEGVIAESTGRTGQNMRDYVATLIPNDNIYREVKQMFVATDVANSFRNPILHGQDTDYPTLENSTHVLILLHLEVAKTAGSPPSSP
jgi:hypothetical protein